MNKDSYRTVATVYSVHYAGMNNEQILLIQTLLQLSIIWYTLIINLIPDISLHTRTILCPRLHLSQYTQYNINIAKANKTIVNNNEFEITDCWIIKVDRFSYY